MGGVSNNHHKKFWVIYYKPGAIHVHTMPPWRGDYVYSKDLKFIYNEVLSDLEKEKHSDVHVFVFLAFPLSQTALKDIEK